MTDELLHKMIAAHRYLRHDFMNDLQVISGYLQMGQAEKALVYTKKTAGRLEVFNSLAKIRLPLLQSFFLSYVTMLGSATHSFVFTIKGDLNTWQEDELLITIIMQEIFDPLTEDILRGELEIVLSISEHSDIDIKYLCARREYFDKLRASLHVLNEDYREKLNIELDEKDGKDLCVKIAKKNQII